MLLLVVAATAAAAAASACAPDAVYVSEASVCIDAFEAAIVVNGSLWPHFDVLDSLQPGTYVATPARAPLFPQGYTSGVQASFACKAAGKRLCTAAEWTAACRGPQSFIYPYGNTYEPGACNEGRAENPVIELFGPHANFNNTEMNDPRLDQLPNTTAPGGAFARCESQLGAFDMHGNMHEWVSDVSPEGHGQFHGGYFVDAKINGPGCLYVTTAHGFSYHDYSIGFRCCADAQ